MLIQRTLKIAAALCLLTLLCAWNAPGLSPEDREIEMDGRPHDEPHSGYDRSDNRNMQYGRPVDEERPSSGYGRPSGYERDSRYGSRSGYSRREQGSTSASFSAQPRQIALLLPLSGKHADAAKAVREGFLASYYENGGQQGYAKPSVRIYDTTKHNHIQQVYDLALDEGADFVVGPLSKEDVQQLSTISSHRVRAPILALNQNPASKASPYFVQFALSPEQEAQQIADKAWQTGHRTASIVVPDSDWGKRIVNAFTAQWQHQGGRILHTVYVNASQDQATAVRRLLGIDESQKRANDIKGILSEKVEFQPRRRQDVDMIVMAAPPAQARQLKPLFDFYYAEDVPVYATSSIYSGTPNPKHDRDMNGVIFCDMPWLIDENRGRDIQRLLSKNATSQSDQYKRLFAMGVDAYQLTAHIKHLASNPGTHYPGATGNLSLDHQYQIQRKLSWAKISNGVPTPISP